MANDNVQIKILAPAQNGNLVLNEKTESIEFQEIVVHRNVGSLYGKDAFIQSQIHSIRMLFRMHYWADNLKGVAILGLAIFLGIPMVGAFIGGFIQNGVRFQAGVPGLNQMNNSGGSSGGSSGMIEVNYWKK